MEIKHVFAQKLKHGGSTFSPPLLPACVYFLTSTNPPYFRVMFLATVVGGGLTECQKELKFEHFLTATPPQAPHCLLRRVVSHKLRLLCCALIENRDRKERSKRGVWTVRRRKLSGIVVLNKILLLLWLYIYFLTVSTAWLCVILKG